MGRTLVVINGLMMGNPAVLAPQPCALANVAFELGRVDRKTFIAEAAKLVRTKQNVGRLLSFHKQELIKGKFVRYENVPISVWRKELKKADRKRPPSTPAVPAEPVATEQVNSP